MAKKKHIKRDLLIRIFALLSIPLCALTAAFALYLNSVSETDYNILRVDDYHVSTSEELVEKGDGIYNDHIYLDADITISDADFRIGSDRFPFEGIFDGQGHTVYITYTEVDASTSFFQYLKKGAVVKNTNFVFGDLVVTGTSYGGIVNINDGTLQDCTLRYNSLTISGAGAFSPFVAINRGTIANVLVEGKLQGSLTAAAEQEVFFGNVCIYNHGTLKSAVVTAEYQGFTATDELSILKGITRNNGISAVHYGNLGTGKTITCTAILPKETYTSDKVSDLTVAHSRETVFTDKNIFSTLDFSNWAWELNEDVLTLIVKGAAE